MAKSKLGGLPFLIREQIHQQLLDGIPPADIAKWIFEQPNSNANGAPCAAVWLADSCGDRTKALWNCQNKLYALFNSPRFAAWREQQIERSQLARHINNFAAKLAALTDGDNDAYLLSVINFFVEKIFKGVASVKDVAQLTQAYVRVRKLAREDVGTEAIRKKLEAIATETRQAREKGTDLTEAERAAVLNRVDEIMGVHA